MTTPALGYIPPMTKGITDNPAYVISLVEMLEEEGIESIWTVEHVIMADQYEPLYPYSEDGKAPTAPDTLMPDPLEWLAFAAARTEKLRLGTAVVIASQHSAAILAMINHYSNDKDSIYGLDIGYLDTMKKKN